MNEIGCQPTAKKTLINAYQRLDATADRLDDLLKFSEKLVAIFERTGEVPCKTEIITDNECKNSKPDIIDLFNGINNRMDDLLTKIGSNIEKVVNMIE